MFGCSSNDVGLEGISLDQHVIAIKLIPFVFVWAALLFSMVKVRQPIVVFGMITMSALGWFLVPLSAKALSWVILVIFSAVFSTLRASRPQKQIVQSYYFFQFILGVFVFLVSRVSSLPYALEAGFLAVTAAMMSPFHLLIFRKFFLAHQTRDLLMVVVPGALCLIDLMSTIMSSGAGIDRQNVDLIIICFTLASTILSLLISILGNGSRYLMVWLLAATLPFLTFSFLGQASGPISSAIYFSMIIWLIPIIGMVMNENFSWITRMSTSMLGVVGYLFGSGLIGKVVLGLKSGHRDLISACAFLFVITFAFRLSTHLNRFRVGRKGISSNYLVVMGCAVLAIGSLVWLHGGIQ